MRLTAIPRITFGLVSLSVGLLLAFDLLLHLFPRDADTIAQQRSLQAQNLAIQVSALVQARDLRSVDRSLQALQAADPAVVSIGLRRDDGVLLAQSAEHARRWALQGSDKTQQRVVGIVAESRRWGALEVVFRPAPQRSLKSWLNSGPTQLLLLFSLSATLLFFAYLRRMLQHLDPAGAVPERVRGAFDALSEGVMIVDPQDRILLVNQRFEALVPSAPRSQAGGVDDAAAGPPPAAPGSRGTLIGRSATSLDWLLPRGGNRAAGQRPWLAAMRSGQPLRGQPFQIGPDGAVTARVVINCSPLQEDNGAVRGCLVTLDDVTALEQSHEQLLEVLADLATSRDQLELKNQELEQLANTDALSGCHNRRAFFNSLHRLFAAAQAQPGGRGELVCLLADIDHFKQINDRHGHAVGDEAIQRFAAVLKAGVPRGGVVGRYGGEEFCVALPGVTLARGLQIAEGLRLQVAAERGVGLGTGSPVPMTASFGVTTVHAGAANEAELVNQADQAMYLAKQSGRNRVVAFGQAAAATAAPSPAADSPAQKALP